MPPQLCGWFWTRRHMSYLIGSSQSRYHFNLVAEETEVSYQVTLSGFEPNYKSATDVLRREAWIYTQTSGEGPEPWD